MNRYVYHADVEPPARPNASGNQNILRLGASSLPVMLPCPAWGCEGPPRNWFGPPGRVQNWYGPPVYAPWTGSTSSVPQPPPTSGTTLVVGAPSGPPLSPQPSPTVPGPTDLSLTQPGQTIAAATGTPWDLGTWLGESTLISGFPNWGVAAAGLAVAYMLFGGKAGRR
jgi:hypothetical protein